MSGIDCGIRIKLVCKVELNDALVIEICIIRYFFFFQAEDGIRDYKVTGVQTCALPIFAVAGIIFGLLSWLQPVPRPYFVPIWITEYESRQLPVNAEAEPDREALRSGDRKSVV